MMNLLKFFIFGGLSALAGSLITITIIEVREPTPIECPIISEPSGVDTDTFKFVSPKNSGQDKEY